MFSEASVIRIFSVSGYFDSIDLHRDWRSVHFSLFVFSVILSMLVQRTGSLFFVI